MLRNRVGRLVAVGVLAFLLIGCTLQAGERTANTPEVDSGAEGPSFSAAPAAVSPSAAVPHDADKPSTSPEVGAEAITIAIAVVTAFCRPTLDRETWINDLYPFLSQTAAVAYGTVNPARVPCTTVTGGARVRDGDGTFTIRVTVPTDGGNYSVYVHRPEVTDPWLVEQVLPLVGD